MRWPGPNRLRGWAEHIINRVAPGPRLLLYHRIATLPTDPQLLAVTPERFAEHLDLLRRHCTVLPLSELVGLREKGRASSRMVAITFDDGYADNLYEAKRLLDQARFPATAYVATGTLNTSLEFWWDELERLLLVPRSLPEELHLCLSGEHTVTMLGDCNKYGECRWKELRNWNVQCPETPTPRHTLYRLLCQRLRTETPLVREETLTKLRQQTGFAKSGRASHRAMTSEELRRLATGRVEIGGHTVTHTRLSSLCVQEQREEICGGLQFLQRVLGRPITHFSYPFGNRGDFSNETINILKEMGILHACTTCAMRLRSRHDNYALPRHVVRNWTGDQFMHWLKT